MSISVVSISTPYTSTSTTSVTVNTPSGVQAGHLLVAHIAWESNSNLISSVPADWTQIFNATAGTRAIRHALYYKVATASEPTSYTWSLSSAVEAIGFIIAFSGVDTASPIGNYSNSTSTSSSTSHTAPAINIQAAGNWAIHCAATAYGTTYTPPSGYTERYDTRTGTGSANIAATLSTKEYTAVGSTGNITATSANADYFVAALVELKAFIANRNGSFTISSTTSTSDSGNSGRFFGFAISQASDISVVGLKGASEDYSGEFIISATTSLDTLGVKKNSGQLVISSIGAFSNSGKKSSAGSFVTINLTSSTSNAGKKGGRGYIDTIAVAQSVSNDGKKAGKSSIETIIVTQSISNNGKKEGKGSIGTITASQNISNVGKRGSLGSFNVGSEASFTKSGYKQGENLIELSLANLITFAGIAQEQANSFYGSFAVTETGEVVFNGKKEVANIIDIIESLALSLFGQSREIINLEKRSKIFTTIVGKSSIKPINLVKRNNISPTIIGKSKIQTIIES